MHHYPSTASTRSRAQWSGWSLLVAFAVSAACGRAWAEGQSSAPVTGFGAPVNAGLLEELRGGEAKSELRNNGIVSDNHAENVVTGTNSLTGGAFSNANGISTVIQNSGANVLIQNAMIVNVQFSGSGP